MWLIKKAVRSHSHPRFPQKLGDLEYIERLRKGHNIGSAYVGDYEPSVGSDTQQLPFTFTAYPGGTLLRPISRTVQGFSDWGNCIRLAGNCVGDTAVMPNRLIAIFLACMDTLN